MKKLTLLAMGFMLGALSFTACQHDVTAPEETAKNEIKLQIVAPGATAINEDDTRTVMNGDKTTGFNTSWVQATDKLGVYSYNADVTSNELTMNAQFDIAEINDGIATFEGKIRYDVEDRTFDLYAYYPRAAANTFANSTYDNVAVSIASTQTMSANNTHDATNDLMVAAPGQQVTVTGGATLTASLDNFQFRYLVGFLNLSVKDITAEGIAATDVVKSVKITADGTPTIAGNFALNLADGAMTFTSTSNEVTVNVPAGVTLGDLSAWAVVNPFATEELTFLITTETHTIEKTATVPGFNIAAGRIKTFNMTIDENCTITELEEEEEPKEYVMISTADAVGAGETIIAYKLGTAWYYLPNTAATNAGPIPVALTVANNEITSTITDDMKWTVTGDNTTGLTFMSYANNANFLWSTASNSGVRVNTANTSTGATKSFLFENNTVYGEKTGLNMLGSGNTNIDANTYVLCIYNTQDWRNYKRTATIANYKGALYLFQVQ